MNRVILHCDLNNFYASVECMYNPELRNKPVAVCGSKDLRHGIVLAKNYVAKKHGIITGEAIWQARKKSPGLIVINPNYSLYLRFSKEAREIYSKYTNLIEAFGIDECWIDVTESTKVFGSGETIAHEIRKHFGHYAIQRALLLKDKALNGNPIEDNIITGDGTSKKVVNLFKWGFPNFKQTSSVIINARCETLEERPTFKNIFHSKRCLVPASGFYEWKKTEDKKEKYLIRTENQELFYMAGLYNTFKDKNGNPFTGFVIITTEANERMSQIHNRMPVIFERKDIDNWLDNKIKDLTEIKKLLKPYKNDELKFLKIG